MPDESINLRYRKLLEQLDLTTSNFAEMTGEPSKNDVKIYLGAVVDAMLLARPSWTTTQRGQRDQVMTQAKKPNHWHFGLNTNICFDSKGSPIHTVECVAEVADITALDACLHGEEEIALDNQGFQKVSRAIEQFDKEGVFSVITTTRKTTGCEFD